MKTIIICLGFLILGSSKIKAQSTDATNAWNNSRFLGFNFSNGANPLLIKTNNTTRMHINGNGTFATGVFTNGFIGIGTNNPISPLHIVGNQQANSRGWRRGLTLSYNAAIQWDGDGERGFFMAHPSGTPNGNWYAGINSNQLPTSAVEYAFSVYVNDIFSSSNPIGTTQFFKNVLVYDGNNIARRFGVNTQNPQQAAEVYSNGTQMRLSYGAANSTSSIPSVFTDFKTNNSGNLQIMPTGQRVAVNLNANPTATLDVNGNMRIRNVQTGTANSLLIGTNANGSGDVNVRRLDFNGNANTFLSGNGTFQTVNTTPPPANNGVSRFTLFNPNAPYQLGDVYSGIPNIFNTNTALAVDRQVRLNNHNFVFSGTGRVGIGLNFPVMPSEVLDINGNTRLRDVPAQGGQSIMLGLQNGLNPNDVEFSRLIFPNDATKVLLGNGTWGQSSSGGVGNKCGAPVNSLITDYEIPLNNHNFYFTNNDALGQNHVGIGYNCINQLQGKLSVYQHHLATVGTSTTGIYAHNDDVANIQGLNYNGVYGSADGVQTINKTLNRGGYFTAKNSDYTMGVMGEINDVNQVNGNAYAGNFEATTGATNNFAVKAMAFGLPTNNQNVGVMAEAMNSNFQNIGGLFRTYGSQGQISTNIGVVGAASPLTIPITIPDGANIGVYGNSANLIANSGSSIGYAGFFDGNVWINGPATGTGYASTFSDANFKTNVLNQVNANDILNQLSPKTFYFDTLNIYGLHFNSSLQHGLIAQEVEVILPELVHNQRKPAMIDSIGNIVTPELNYKALDYSAFISVLIKGHQEQGLTIDSLQSSNDSLHAQVDEINDRLTQLENCLSGILPFLCQLSQQAIQTNTPETQQAIRSQLTVILDNKETIILDQNVPNPFAEQTTINFSIPESVKKAQIQFYDGLGSLIKTVDVKERGLGSLTVFGSDLSSGTYLYKLVADGILVATKKMVKE